MQERNYNKCVSYKTFYPSVLQDLTFRKTNIFWNKFKTKEKKIFQPI